MKKQLVVRLKSGHEITYVPNEVTLNNTFIDVPSLLNENSFPLLIHFTHDALVSTLNLSKMPDCALLHLKDDFRPKSATLCLNRDVGDFAVQSQCKRVLLIPFPLPFAIPDITSIHSTNKK